MASLNYLAALLIAGETFRVPPTGLTVNVEEFREVEFEPIPFGGFCVAYDHRYGWRLIYQGMWSFGTAAEGLAFAKNMREVTAPGSAIEAASVWTGDYASESLNEFYWDLFVEEPFHVVRTVPGSERRREWRMVLIAQDPEVHLSGPGSWMPSPGAYPVPEGSGTGGTSGGPGAGGPYDEGSDNPEEFIFMPMAQAYEAMRTWAGAVEATTDANALINQQAIVAPTAGAAQYRMTVAQVVGCRGVPGSGGGPTTFRISTVQRGGVGGSHVDVTVGEEDAIGTAVTVNLNRPAAGVWYVWPTVEGGHVDVTVGFGIKSA